MELHKFTLVTSVVRTGDGQGRVNLEVVREARRQGIEVVLVASEIAPELVGDPGVTWVPVSAKGFPTYLLRELVFSVRSTFALRTCKNGPLLSNGCITRAPADVNACHFVHSSWVASPVHPSRLRGGPGAAYHRLYSSMNALFERRAYRLAKKVVSVSEQVRTELASIGIDPGLIGLLVRFVFAEPGGLFLRSHWEGAELRAR